MVTANPFASNGTLPSFWYLSTVLVGTSFWYLSTVLVGTSMVPFIISYLLCERNFEKREENPTPCLGIAESIPHYVVHLLFCERLVLCIS
uniref:Uncharacterized protein n=1 Tax=Oryza brachyantha TaxID=4533 RepID=J3M064_ORYBR